MEFGPIFRSLLHNRTRFVLIALEVALTLAIVTNCSSMILDLRKTLTMDSGMDEENILVLTLQTYDEELREETTGKAQQKEDLRRLRQMPGVRQAMAIHQVPLSGGGSATGRGAEGAEVFHTLPYFRTGEGALETLGVELVAGRDFTPEDYLAEENHNVILNRALAEQIFPEGDALGKVITNRDGDESHRVVGIIDVMANSWPSSEVGDRTALFPYTPWDPQRLFYMVRAEPGQVDQVYRQVEGELLASREGRLVEVRTLAEVRADTFNDISILASLLLIIMGLLLFVTLLGIVGVTSFSVTQRTRQIGTRRALGATRGAILRYFLVENVMVSAVGLLLGLGLTQLLAYLLVRYAGGVRPDAWLIGGAAAALWLAGMLAAWMPARRGMRVEPVIATRGV